MEGNKLGLGNFYSIICKASDLALRNDELDPNKYLKSRVIGVPPDHQDINQLWTVWNTNNKPDGFQIVNEVSALAFDEQSGEIRLKQARQNSDQLFAVCKANVQAFYEYFWIKTSAKGDKALSLEGILRYKNFDPNDQSQLFRFEIVNDNKVVNETSIIINNYSGKALDVPAFSRQKCQVIIQYSKTKRMNQRWNFIKHGQGLVIKSLFNKLVLDVYQFKKKAGTKIIQYEDHRNQNQIWIPESLGNGLYRFRSAMVPQMFLSMKDQSIDDGGKLEITDKDNPTSLWKIQGGQI